MYKTIVFVFSAVVGAQSLLYAPPYPQGCPCTCGKPALPAILPASAPCGNPPLLAAPAKAPLLAAPIGLPFAAPVPKAPCGCLEPALPKFDLPLPLGLPCGNPFLPAASPVSALAPFSMLPPACPCSRCQYLKKIPIPPPCI